MDVPTWKWESINMDFVVGLPQTQRQNEFAWAPVDKLTKSSHIIPVKSTYTTEDYARICVNEIVSLYGIPLSNFSYRGSQFTSNF